MATKKTPAKKSTPKAKVAKDEPVILDPPQKPTDTVEPAAEVIDAKIVEVSKSEPENTATTTTAQKPKTAPSQIRAFSGMLIGGVVAAVIGYLAAGYINPPPPPANNTAEITAATAEFNAQIDELTTRIAELENAPVAKFEQDIAKLNAALEELKQTVTAQLSKTESKLNGALSDLENARTRLSASLAGAGDDISSTTRELIAQYGADIDALKLRLEAQALNAEDMGGRLDLLTSQAREQLTAARKKVEELSGDIASSAKNIDMSLARERLNTALATGKAYADVLSEIAAQAKIDIPKILNDGAATGVTTLPELQQKFPEAARRALKASVQAEAGDSFGDKIGAYLKAQLGARSLEEKQGNDPDAILSRAEGALARDELQNAVDLLRELPEQGVAEMADWLAAAEGRLKIQAAMDAFTQSFGDGN